MKSNKLPKDPYFFSSSSIFTVAYVKVFFHRLFFLLDPDPYIFIRILITDCIPSQRRIPNGPPQVPLPHQVRLVHDCIVDQARPCLRNYTVSTCISFLRRTISGTATVPVRAPYSLPLTGLAFASTQFWVSVLWPMQLRYRYITGTAVLILLQFES